jgi:RNA polymerase sigma-70 factor (ECF subfamily)
VSNAAFHTTLLHRCLDRLRAGDDSAYDELIDYTGERLRVLASRMLQSFPAVRRWEDTQDVLQDAHVRLLRDLRDKAKRPASVRDFFNLAANRLRSVLLNLHQHYQRPAGMGQNLADGPVTPVPDPAPDSAELDRWTAFHEAVGKLDPTEREVVELRFYQGFDPGRGGGAASGERPHGAQALGPRLHAPARRARRRAAPDLKKEEISFPAVRSGSFRRFLLREGRARRPSATCGTIAEGMTHGAPRTPGRVAGELARGL